MKLLHEALHVLAVAGPPEDASSLIVGESRCVTLELAARGLGPAGSVQVLPHLLGQWADPCFDWVGRHAPTQPRSQCPNAQALLEPPRSKGWWRVQAKCQTLLSS